MLRCKDGRFWPIIPIVFSVGEDPVKFGLVATLAKPGGNATGNNFFSTEVLSKRLGLLHELVPKATQIAVLVNPSEPVTADSTIQAVSEAARAIGLQIRVLNASTIREIEAAFASLAQARADALFTGPDAFFSSRRAQFATLAAHYSIPAAFGNRDYVEAGGLMSFGTDVADSYRQVGAYTGRILKGAKPEDLPVLQSAKFQFVINLQTARLLGIEVSPELLTRADDLVERRLVCCAAHGKFWPDSEVSECPLHVRYRGQTGLRQGPFLHSAK
jgi:putative ABC transport system substrate-binding protein